MLYVSFRMYLMSSPSSNDEWNTADVGDGHECDEDVQSVSHASHHYGLSADAGSAIVGRTIVYHARIHT